MISILTDPGVGGTFLNWSIYYLAGRNYYFSARLQRTNKVPTNPLGNKNAHVFVVNHPYNFKEFEQFLPMLLDKDECLYMHEFRDKTKEAVTTLLTHTSKTIVVALTKDQLLYKCSYEPRASVQPAWGSKKTLSNPDEIYDDLVNYFFKESVDTWKQENLNDTWDKREFIALNFNPTNHTSILEYINSSAPVYYINPIDLWTNFDSSIHDLFDYLDIEIDKSRYQKWLLIYNQWKNVHKQKLMFVWYFDTIINNILQGIDFDLIRFNLDITQEATIQHFLIYKHNLNFKTWQLTKFTNTRQLHELLEPNIHPL